MPRVIEDSKSLADLKDFLKSWDDVQSEFSLDEVIKALWANEQLRRSHKRYSLKNAAVMEELQKNHPEEFARIKAEVKAQMGRLDDNTER